MKDYKGRGSNLTFGERKKSRRGWVVALLLAAAATGIYVGLQWWQPNAQPPQAAKSPQAGSASGTAIPLQLPPAPAQSTPPDDRTGS